MKFWVGTTDSDWFRFLSIRMFDEVNFWQPSASAPFKTTDVGMPFLFKLKKPYNHIAGGGFFVGHSSVPVSLAWEIFGEKNGASTYKDLLDRLLRLRRSPADALHAIGCQIIANPVFLPRDRWLAEPPGWSPNIVRGRMYDTQEPDGARIWATVGPQLETRLRDSLSEQTGLPPIPMVAAEVERFGAETVARPRLGQGAFRLLLTDLYKRRCAITGESTLPTLEAAHIVPYSDHGTHDVRNGLLLRADFHKLFDVGLVGVLPNRTVRISQRIKDSWFNGRAYYSLEGRQLAVLPDDPRDQPDPDLLDWHMRHVFQG